MIRKSAKGIVDVIPLNVKKLILSTISDVEDEEGWAFLGEVGTLMQKKQPNFDPLIPV